MLYTIVDTSVIHNELCNHLQTENAESSDVLRRLVGHGRFPRIRVERDEVAHQGGSELEHRFAEVIVDQSLLVLFVAGPVVAVVTAVAENSVRDR